MGFVLFEDEKKHYTATDIIELNLPEQIIGVSKVFASAKKQMSIAEYKTLVFALTNFRFKDENNHYVWIDKKELANALDIHSDTDHLSQDVFDNIRELPKHSFIEIRDVGRGIFDSGCIVTRVTSLKNQFRIKFDDEYLKLFSNLKDGEYVTLWSSDILSMQSSRSIDFYEFLRLHTDTRDEVNRGVISIKALKEMFDIPKDGPGSYMRDKGGFDRANFEKKVIDPLFEDLAKCKMIIPVKLENGKYYEKLKKNGRVIGYEFFWNYAAYPKVANEIEVKRLQERVDKNPEILKVAKDIVKGDERKKTGKSKKTVKPDHRDYDQLELEKMLLNIEK